MNRRRAPIAVEDLVALTRKVDNPPIIPWSPGCASADKEQYGEYSLLKFQELEAKEQARRAVVPDRSNRERAMPRGGDSRGWFSHWRRGINGALCSWAQGSLGAIVYMLARCARLGIG